MSACCIRKQSKFGEKVVIVDDHKPHVIDLLGAIWSMNSPEA